MSTPAQYLTDKDIQEGSQDEFQRYEFAKRIANTILSQGNHESLAIGLYGQWGEGKTSVLNFIWKELNEPGTIRMLFNPWRYEGEDEILIAFFTGLAQVLNKRLRTKGEQAGVLIAQYAEAIIPKFEFFDGAVSTEPGTNVKKIGELLSTRSVPELKERVEAFLKKTKKRVVIFIDDIDRLDRKEIQALFRLIKLTADFNFVTYLLSFDDVMVARALGEIYEGGGEAAGHSFLEKIIQVPLRMPATNVQTMHDFLNNRLRQVLTQAGVALTDYEHQSLHFALRSSVLTRLTTPRQAVRYCNALGFSIGLLQGEVRTHDLILIEALKAFYPEVYRFISHQRHNITGATLQQTDQDRLKRDLDPILELTSPHLAARTLLFMLFPRILLVYKAIDNMGLFGSRNDQDLVAQKAIASDYYFQRYFSYAVQRGEISDRQFVQLLQLLDSNALEPALQLARGLMEHASPKELLRRLSVYVNDARTLPYSQTYIHLLARLGPKFQIGPNRWHDSDADAAARLLIELLRYIPKEEERYSIAQQLITTQMPFDLSYTFVRELLMHVLHYQSPDRVKLAGHEQPAFSTTQFKDLALLLVKYALTEAGLKPLYEIYSEKTQSLLFEIWPTEAEGISAADYLNHRLTSNPKELYGWLEFIAHDIQIGNNLAFRGDLTMDVFTTASKVLDLGYLHTVARELIGKDTLTLAFEASMTNKPTREERLKQFVYLYEREKHRSDVVNRIANLDMDA
ncbi:KAP family P-loop NTPase fold protein [Hymenobacter lapidiphilus]|uniref:KAP NTPase domain-containing protein n=1 Tax=Hymenobacter lapidiphilus TaxID=2608003 RepID=A0A7Y7PS78_9BACT|nr:P-loop NTPase fold protein [Hymenobacter lapidiphilus]NVO33063.1 hypothetical protein [Hymenobacter lapidiphilus]